MTRTGFTLLAALLLLTLTGAGDVGAQCILANPSFEVAGSSGEVFAGWGGFGNFGFSSDATHGSRAARVTGPNSGIWDMSGYWQRQDTAPGETWEASVRVWHTSVNPLTGGSLALVNIEWRDQYHALLGYESHTVANASTPVDMIQDFSVVSGPAPSGTVGTHILVGVLQDPAEPAPDVFYDEVTFFETGPPSIDDLQWTDFPGGRTLEFSNRTWRVKGPGYYGPGPNLFCDTSNCTWVDAEGRLHLTIQNLSGSWYSTEVTLEDALGYGDYVFTTYGRVDDLHVNTVFGLFLWEYGPCWDSSYLWWNPYNEIDVEFSRWGNPASDVAQFVAQPYDWPGNISRFDATFSEGELTSHAFEWLPDRVEYRSWRGGPQDEASGNMIHSWTYTGPHIPRPEQPRVHLNLWYSSSPPSSTQEVVLDEFTFVPACLDSSCVVAVPGDGPLLDPGSLLAAARPNPFGMRTAIAYHLPEAGDAEILVYDITGRLVRTLVQGFVTAGDHETAWDGRDDAGIQVASGVYLYRLRSGSVVETRRMVLIR